MDKNDRSQTNHMEDLFGKEFSEELNSLLGDRNTSPEPEQREQEQQKMTAPEKEEKEPFQSVFLGYLQDITVILTVLMLLFPVLFRVVQVYGTSMNSTLYDGDYLLLLSSTFYKDPKQGDVIVASKKSFDNGMPIVKRVIATEHQVVDIDFEAGIVYVDGVALDEPYTLEPTNLSEGVNFPQEVQEGCIFVMGDNRNASKDSRSPQIGQIDKREVVGKVLLLILPGTNTDMSIIGRQPFDITRIGVVH